MNGRVLTCPDRGTNPSMSTPPVDPEPTPADTGGADEKPPGAGPNDQDKRVVGRRDNVMAEFIAMGAGTGRGPVAPATWATAFILLLYWALNVESPSAGYFSVLVLIIVAGTWAANRLSVPDDPDPGRVVIDEWAGALVTVAFLPTTAGWMLAGFFVFRVLDILKPWPIRKFEDLHGGVGIMADDIAAGVVGAIGLNVVRVAFF